MHGIDLRSVTPPTPTCSQEREEKERWRGREEGERDGEKGGRRGGREREKKGGGERKREERDTEV